LRPQKKTSGNKTPQREKKNAPPSVARRQVQGDVLHASTLSPSSPAEKRYQKDKKGARNDLFDFGKTILEAKKQSYEMYPQLKASLAMVDFWKLSPGSAST